MRLPVYLQREIARMHFYDPYQSNRAIGRSLSISHNTVGQLRKILNALRKDWASLKNLDDAEWATLLGTQDKRTRERKPRPSWDWVDQEMSRPDATREQVWMEFRGDQPNGIGRSQFNHEYNERLKTKDIALRKVHVPGQKLFLDFAGRTVEIKDRNGGPSSYAQIFVAVLGYSNYTHVFAVASQSTEDWIRCCIDSFNYFGGIPEWVVHDNLKAAVISRKNGAIKLNRAFQECLQHYNTASLPAGPRKPKQKAKAEVGVQIVQRGILFPIRDWDFFSLEELNAELKRRVDQLNSRPFKKMPGSRLDRFISVEKNSLKSLPDIPFETCDWRYDVLVGKDHHIEHARSFYSVPCEFVNKRVDIRFTSTMLEVFFKNKPITLHPLAKTEGEIIAKDEHRPIAHIRVLEGEPREIMRWADTIGQCSNAMIHYHLHERSDVTNGVRAARRMRQLARIYGEFRFEEACNYALQRNITALDSVESILKNSPDKLLADTSPSNNRKPHDNVRGSDYYGADLITENEDE